MSFPRASSLNHSKVRREKHLQKDEMSLSKEHKNIMEHQEEGKVRIIKCVQEIDSNVWSSWHYLLGNIILCQLWTVFRFTMWIKEYYNNKSASIIN
jgi:uncharacterized membrane protein